MSKPNDVKLVTANPHGQLGGGNDIPSISIPVSANAIPVRIVDGNILYSDGSVISTKPIDKENHKILMSRDNPNGYKLEELLEKIVNEVNGKSDYIRDNKALAHIVNNNDQIAVKLCEAIGIQHASLNSLTEKYGEDKGPNNPRV